MNILIAEDDLVSRRALEATLRQWGHSVVVTASGTEAWDVLQGSDSPPLAILDWMMPGLDGVEVCRLARQRVPLDDEHRPLYLMLLTARDRKEDLVAGLEGGADDYLIKPFDRDELRARLDVGLRMVGLQHRLARRVHELHEALQKVKQLQGLLPICSYCKRIRDDQNYWQQVEGYIGAHSEARFSHSICPTCYEVVVQPQLDALQKISCNC
ncbi:MAG: response regulator transcription factor [Planctomycetes bacterium]|nr:response regulator transcription factor [Planctomycetota bacterium]